MPFQQHGHDRLIDLARRLFADIRPVVEHAIHRGEADACGGGHPGAAVEIFEIPARAGVGTGGTITGVSRYLKQEKNLPLLSVAVEPVESPVITQAKAGEELKPGPHKIQGIGAGFIPGNLDLSLVDAVEQVSSDDAIAGAHRLMREEGILAGISSGAALVAAQRLAAKPENAGKNIVIILASAAERYLTSPLFADVFTEQELQA